MKVSFLLSLLLPVVLYSQPTHKVAEKKRPINTRPNIILVMSDDQGWGQTSYNNHPILKTPNLDDMAAHGLRLDRFYAGAPVCSPTRASVLTGRNNDRSAVFTVGYPMCRQEKTIAQALKQFGYHTAHFGKWHLDGIKGAGVPILASDDRNPGNFGFDDWLSTSNYFDINPLLSRNGKFEEFTGGSSEVIVTEALKYIQTVQKDDAPFFVAIWFGSPHGPWSASEADKQPFSSLDSLSQNHYGEMVELDRNVGRLRKALKNMGLSENTLVWFNSDNGGLKNFGPETVGNLRGYKGDVYEGGIRVPCIIEWPSQIKMPRRSVFPASTLDIFPTILELLGMPDSLLLHPIDGISIKQLFTSEMGERKHPIPFSYMGKAALIDDDFKLVMKKNKPDAVELYNLKEDPFEKNNIVASQPQKAAQMLEEYKKWSASIEASSKGADYLGGLKEPHPAPKFWMTAPEYQTFIPMFMKRPEYRNAKNGED